MSTSAQHISVPCLPDTATTPMNDIGMTLLDHFAITALQGIIASTHNCSPEACARLAYEYGVAMLHARKDVLDAYMQEEMPRACS